MQQVKSFNLFVTQAGEPPHFFGDFYGTEISVAEQVELLNAVCAQHGELFTWSERENN